MSFDYKFLLVVAVFILGLIIYQKLLKNLIGTDNRKRLFAEAFKEFSVVYNDRTKDIKSKLFESLGGMGKCVCVLEIGIGSGSNFSFYPTTSKYRLIANEPNEYCSPILNENISKFPNIILDRISPCSAENFHDIPDSSVDAVISTLVLCSVPNVQKTLNEILRILKPGGKFLYIEHVIDPKNSWWRTLQQFLDYVGIWAFLVDGCHLSRKTGVTIQNTGFNWIDQKQVYINADDIFGLKIMKSHIYGVATK